MSAPTQACVVADLRCELNGRPVTIRNDDRTVVVEVPDVATGLGLLRLGSPRGPLRDVTRYITSFVRGTEVALDLRIGDRSIGRLARGTGNVWGRLAGLPEFDLLPGSLAMAALRSR